MNINLKLKKRREIINKEKSHQRTKVIRQYKQQMANDTDLNNKNYKDTNEKFDEYKIKEEKRLNYEKQLYGNDINESDNEVINEKKEDKREIIEKEKEKNKDNKDKMYKKEDKKYIGNKRSREEIEEDKLKKLNKRKKNYRNLHKTNKYGQPLMKYQIANLFDKIKKKKKEGII